MIGPCSTQVRKECACVFCEFMGQIDRKRRRHVDFPRITDDSQPASPSPGSIASSPDAVDDNFSDSKKREATRKQPSRNVKSRDLNYDPAEINDDGSDRTFRPGGPARSSYGPGQIDAVWARASEGAGEIFCPNCETTKLQRSAYGQTWQMGHRPGYEFRHLYKLWNEKRINEMQYLRLYRSPEFYQPECTKCNSSHKFESKSSLYLKKEPQSRSDKGIPGMRYFYNGHEPEYRNAISGGNRDAFTRITFNSQVCYPLHRCKHKP